MNIVLVATYEMGRQPFGLASPAAWLRQLGALVHCVDLSREQFPVATIRDADLVAFYVPMHTATRLAVQLIGPLQHLNPRAHICFYGLYASMNEQYLRSLGVQTILGGEFEEGLAHLAARLRPKGLTANEGLQASGGRLSTADVQSRIKEVPSSIPSESSQQEPVLSLARLRFQIPDRSGLVPLDRYAHLVMNAGDHRAVGYTEASRGCRHLCRHCPIVPVYNGMFRIVDRQVVLEDVRRQIAAGARHITFGDPDFFNGVGHALAIVQELHREHPRITYDVTIKIEHLRKHRQHLETLRDTGCLFVTSAVESVDDAVLERLDKGHTRADVLATVRDFRELGMILQPTLVPFTPWTTLESFAELLRILREEELQEHVAPIQLAIRLLIPASSRLLELPEVSELVGPFDPERLAHPWHHPDSRVDALCEEVQDIVAAGEKMKRSRSAAFEAIHRAASRALGISEEAWRTAEPRIARAAIPYLDEPWYC
ncbi:MAG TPA: CUAEP/CCAEP-tail radical SAM protein [Candidatus Dormibacteraeota bacterium]|nr:CUAEP/CCAEP-tail radical SAM protein [Candidatus Dormibacteraeota bacterium]